MSIKQNGNKIILIMCAVLLTSTLTGCPARDDWSYSELPNEYMIMRVNGGDVQFGKVENQQYVKRIDRYVIAFSYGERYIGIQQIPIESPYSEMINVEELDQSKLEYYLIDSETDVIYGPWTLYEYNNELEECEISDMCEWISTDSRPNGAE